MILGLGVDGSFKYLFIFSGRKDDELLFSNEQIKTSSMLLESACVYNGVDGLKI